MVVPIGIILRLYRGYIGIMEKKMETTIVFWGIFRQLSLTLVPCKFGTQRMHRVQG